MMDNKKTYLNLNEYCLLQFLEEPDNLLNLTSVLDKIYMEVLSEKV